MSQIKLKFTDYSSGRVATVESVDEALPAIRSWFRDAPPTTRYYIDTLLSTLERETINPSMLRNKLFIGVEVTTSDTVVA